MGQVWIKGWGSLSEYSRLREFLQANGQYVRTEPYESQWFDENGSLVIEKHDGYACIKKKIGNPDDEVYEEIEIRCRDQDYDQLDELFTSMGNKTSAVWKRTRELFDWWPVLVYLDKIEDFGVIVEFKLYAQLKDKQAAIEEAKERIKKMGLELISKEDFLSKEKEFIKNWR